ncbi:MAG TPA: UbiA family prenyltransferase [Acidobacteriaceae bacterium]|jgi:4-hydroxybenzoate polyprenyltransferase
MATTAPTALERPLCVDLDGTLVKSDTLVDSLLLLVRTRPLDALKTPLWALRGKANLKREVTARVTLNVEHLPYNRPLLEYLMAQRGEGRKLYLATGADAGLADRIARHLNIFEGVLSSDGATNLTGRNKLAGFRTRFAGEFDYIGNARPDLPLLAAAATPMLANPDIGLRMAMRARGLKPQHTFTDRASSLRTFIKAIRVHQWAKNTLIFLPLLLAHRMHGNVILSAALAFVCFSLCASATYIVNDLLDVEADRQHPRKRKRAFAAGNLSAGAGIAISAVFLIASFAGAALLLPQSFLGWLALYLVTTLAYSLALKRIVILDVVILSALYTLRMLAGAAATTVFISPWLAAFAIFIFLSLAMVKRFSELQNVRSAGAQLSNGRGYLLNDIEQIRSFGTSSAFASVVVLSVYIGQPDMLSLYHHHVRMWLMPPLLILWLCRVWLLASRGELDEDPVVFALTDRMSLLMGAAAAVIALASL